MYPWVYYVPQVGNHSGLGCSVRAQSFFVVRI